MTVPGALFLGTYLSGVTGSEQTAIIEALDELTGRVSPIQFGTVPADDGTIDQTDFVQAAIDGKSAPLAEGIYGISSTIYLGDGSQFAPSTVQNLWLRGDAPRGAANQEISPGVSGSVTLKWIGPSGGTMVEFRGPVVASMTNIMLDGNGLADWGYKATHLIGGSIDCVVVNVRKGYADFAAYEDPTDCYTSSGADVIVRMRGFDPVAGTNFQAVRVGNSTYAATGKGLDVARLHFEYLEVGRPSGASNSGIVFQMCDNITFGRVFSYGPSNTVGNAFEIKPATGHALAPYYPTCVGMSDVRYKGAWTVTGTWTPNSSGARGRGIFISRLQEGDSGEIRPDHPAISGFTYAGVPFGSMAPIYRLPAQVQVTGTTTQTQVFSAPIHGYALDNNRKMRMKLSGAYVNATGATRSLSAYVDYGLEVVFNGTEPAVPVGSGAWFMDVDIAPLNESTTAQVSSAEMRFYASGSLGGAGQVQTAAGPIGAAALPTVDSAVEQNLRLLVTPGHAGLVIDVHSVIVEVV